MTIEKAIEKRDNDDNRENAAAIYEKLGMQYEQAGNAPGDSLTLS